MPNFGLLDGHEVVLYLLRWIHFLAGITWIGHLYYFNLVQPHFEKTLDGGAKKVVVPNNRGRALFWFRWGAMLTMLSGVLWIVWSLFIKPGGVGAAYFKTERGIWISFGGTLGLIMWFNVWFVIWPRQKKIIPGVVTGNKPADFDALVATAGKFSRINTYLSVPMLFAMGAAPGHLSTPGKRLTLAMVGVALVLGLLIAHLFITKIAPKVGAEFVPPAPPPPPPPK